MPKFSVELAGSFYTYELYNAAGEHIFNVSDAAECAEEQYGTDWQSVYNGNEAIDRDDYLEGLENET